MQTGNPHIIQTDDIIFKCLGRHSHYWIVNRLPLSVRTLTERFTLQHQTGYLAYEFLDGRLTRPEAVKVLQIETA